MNEILREIIERQIRTQKEELIEALELCLDEEDDICF